MAMAALHKVIGGKPARDDGEVHDAAGDEGANALLEQLRAGTSSDSSKDILVENSHLQEECERLQEENLQLQAVVAGIKQLVLSEPAAIKASVHVASPKSIGATAPPISHQTRGGASPGAKAAAPQASATVDSQPQVAPPYAAGAPLAAVAEESSPQAVIAPAAAELVSAAVFSSSGELTSSSTLAAEPAAPAAAALSGAEAPAASDATRGTGESILDTLPDIRCHITSLEGEEIQVTFTWDGQQTSTASQSQPSLV